MTDERPNGTGADGSDRSAGDIQAIHRCAQILRLLTEGDTTRTADVAATLGLERSTAHRYLTSMANAGLVERGDGGFRLGPLARHLGAVSLRRTRVIEEAAPYMAGLAEGVHETVVISVWSGRGAVVARVETDPWRQVQVLVREGSQLPLFAAQSQVFLEMLPDRRQVESLMGQLTVAQRRDVEEGMARFRALGVAENSVVAQGIRTLAVPVVDDRGAVVATLAVVGTTEAVPADVESGVARALRQTAEQLSAHLAGLPAPGPLTERKQGVS
jgi:DNA-binding IclR family transcriptional regulator